MDHCAENSWNIPGGQCLDSVLWGENNVADPSWACCGCYDDTNGTCDGWATHMQPHANLIISTVQHVIYGLLFQTYTGQINYFRDFHFRQAREKIMTLMFVVFSSLSGHLIRCNNDMVMTQLHFINSFDHLPWPCDTGYDPSLDSWTSSMQSGTTNVIISGLIYELSV